jgi:putative ribosome biogenesis GTPase RsgA
MDFDIGDEVRKQIEDAFRKRGRVTLVIAGRSGVGKSTLINAIFHARLYVQSLLRVQHHTRLKLRLL